MVQSKKPGRGRSGKSGCAWIIGIVIGLALLALFTKTTPLPPPVGVTYRQSLVGMGMVVQITNKSSYHLYKVTVVGRNIKQVSSASVKATDHLSPGGSVEVGWLEFGNWVPEPGETIEVYCDNYATPAVSVVPKP
jgi:hypothetical protein